jgi:hypothetical protein
MYPSLSSSTIAVSLNLSLFLLCSCCQVLWLRSYKSCSIVYGLTLVWGLCNSNISMRTGQPSIHSQQKCSGVQLCVPKPICGPTVMCKPAHGPPVLPFLPNANNCRSEHIHRMVLSDVAATTEEHQGKYMGLIMTKRFILNVWHFSF